MTDTKNPDEIMAEYLLKGGKMLAKTCPVCHSPLFEYKEKTFCVVCAENETVPSSPQHAAPAQSSGRTPPPHTTMSAPYGLEDEFAQTFRVLLAKAREEQDSTRLLNLMESIKKGAEAYSLLVYGYGRRDNS